MEIDLLIAMYNLPMHILFRRVDVKAGSGSVIHIVQKVIPTVKQSDNIAAVVSSDPQFSTLLAAVQAAGLANALSSTGLFFITNKFCFTFPNRIFHFFAFDCKIPSLFLHQPMMPSPRFLRTLYRPSWLTKIC